MKKYISTTKEATTELMNIINKYDSMEISEEQLEESIKHYCHTYPMLIFDISINKDNDNDNEYLDLKKSIRRILGKRRSIIIKSVLSKINIKLKESLYSII